MAPKPNRPKKPLSGAEQDELLGPPPELMQAEQEEHVLQTATMLKRSLSTLRVLPEGVAHCASKTIMRGMCWRKRLFELTSRKIRYFEPGVAESKQVLKAEFEVSELDFVFVRGRLVHLHFASAQQFGRRRKKGRIHLVTFTTTVEEAEQWARGVQEAAATRLRLLLPSKWCVERMINTSVAPSKRVVKEELTSDALQWIQYIVDHAFISKRTRDRQGQELPLRLEVVKAVSVQNVAAWKNYSMARNRVRSAVVTSSADPLEPEVLTSASGCSGSLGWLDNAANEHWLFHGTRVEAAQYITDGVFRMDLAGSHRGSLYGKAVYMAECSSKADEYAHPDDQGIHRMLICRAALGCILIERNKDPNPPGFEELAQAGYNSVCGDRWAAVGTFREFVVYDPSQIYPEYIIYYRRHYEADLLQAISTLSEENDIDGVRKLVPYAARLAQTHRDPQVKYRFSLLLGAHAQKVVPALTACLRDELALRRRTAAVALGHVGEFVRPTAGESCSSPEQDESVAAITAAVPALVDCLCDPCDDVRKATAQALVQIGPAAMLAAPALADCLSDDCVEVRCAAAAAVAALGTGCAANAVPALAAACLRDPEIRFQMAAIHALCQFGGSAASAVQPLTELLRTLPNPTIQCALAAFLGNMGGYATSALPCLRVCCKDADALVRAASVKALGQITAFTNSDKILLLTSKMLAKALLDEDGNVQTNAATAIGHLGLKTRIANLCKVLRTGSDDVRKASATALSTMIEPGTRYLPILVKALKDSNESVREIVARSFGQQGINSTSALRALTTCLSDSSALVRKAAVDALGEVGISAPSTKAGVQERMKDPDAQVRKAACAAFEKLELAAVQLLIEEEGYLDELDSVQEIVETSSCDDF